MAHFPLVSSASARRRPQLVLGGWLRTIVVRTRAGRATLGRTDLATFGATVLVCALVFPVFLVDVGWGLDQSWAAALHLAAHRDLAFGRDVVFTYGPLGFLAVPYMYFPLQGTVALLLRVPLLFLVAYFVVSRLRRVLPWPVAVIAALPVTWTAGSALLGGGETVIVPVLVLVSVWMSHFATHDRALPAWSAPATGVAAGLLLLCKFDMGLLTIAFATLAMLGDHLAFRGRLPDLARRVGLLVGSFAATVVLVWVVIGQPLRTLGSWLRLSWQIFIGFNNAMAASYGPRWEMYLALVAAIGVGFLVVDRAKDFDGRRRLALVGFTVLVLAAFAKQGFVRHDSHSLRFHAVTVLACVAFVGRDNRRLAFAVAAPAVVAAITVVGAIPFLHPGASIKMVRRVTELSLFASKRTAVIDWGRKAIPIVYPVPQTMIDRMRGHTAHIEPIQAVIAWVHADIRWRPLPVFQSYSAYTPTLDRLNADMYRSPDGPEFVLYERVGIDDRIARWESPQAMLAFLCGYTIVETSSQWQLFQRAPAGDRCGLPRQLATVRGRRGEAMVMPPPLADQIVVARFSGPGLHPGLVDRLRALLTRPALYTVLVKGDPIAHRVVTANRAQPHIVSVPACLQGKLGTFDTGTMSALTFATTSPPSPGPAITATLEAIAYRCP